LAAALRKQAVAALQSRGHELDDCDLYAEAFDPVWVSRKRLLYHDTKHNRAPITAYADRLACPTETSDC
jgi:NAD(P)H dehydrogenase (quinone)